MSHSDQLAVDIHKAIIMARDPSSPPEVRAACALKLKKAKHYPDVNLLLKTIVHLVNEDVTRRPAFKMLRDLVRDRWEEFDSTQKGVIYEHARKLVKMSCSKWNTKSEAAEFMAEVVRKGLTDFHSFDRFIEVVTEEEDEIAGRILKYLQEDITVDTDYLKGVSRESLLHHLTDLAPKIIELLISLFNKHVGASWDIAAPELIQHPNDTMLSILSALTGYAAWAPIKDVSWSPVINRCVIWFSTYKSIPACNFLKVICQREPTSGMTEFLNVLLTISKGFTSGSKLQLRSDCEFTECICDAMNALGCSNVLHVLSDKDWIVGYLQEMLCYYGNHRIELQSKSLSFWLVVLPVSPTTGNVNKRIASYIPEDMYPQLLDISVRNMLKEGAVPYLGASGPSNKGFQGESDFSDHPTKLMNLMKAIAYGRPVEAASFVIQRLSDMFPLVKQGEICPKDLQTIKSTIECLEKIVDVIFGDDYNWINQDQSSKDQIHNRFEGLLAAIISLDLSETWAIELQGRFLSLFGLYYKTYPKEIMSVLEKFLFLLVSLHPTNLPSDSNEARFTIRNLLINISHVASDAFDLEKSRVSGILAKYQNNNMILLEEYEDLRRELALDVMHVDLP